VRLPIRDSRDTNRFISELIENESVQLPFGNPDDVSSVHKSADIIESRTDIRSAEVLGAPTISTVVFP